jgi:hypothetical protein
MEVFDTFCRQENDMVNISFAESHDLLLKIDSCWCLKPGIYIANCLLPIGMGWHDFTIRN